MQDKMQIPDNQIHIQIKDGKLRTHADKPMAPLDLLAVLFTVQLGLMNETLAKADDSIKQQIKEDLYDRYNYGASNVLEMFAPEFELRPNLTSEAILKAENDILEENYVKSKPKVKPALEVVK